MMPTPPARSLLLLAVLAGGATALAAAPPAAPPFGLAQAQAIAREQNPELVAARAALAAAEARTRAARAERWPTVGLGSELLRTDNPAAAFAARLNAGRLGAGDLALPRLNDPAAITRWSAGVSLAAPLDVAGKIGALAAARAADAEAAAADLAELEGEVALRVEQAYREAALAVLAAAATEQAVAAAHERESALAAQVEQGAALAADLLRARSRRRSREADLAARHAERDTALAELGRLLGDAGPTGADAAAFEAPSPPPAREPEDVLVARALRDRPRLRAAGARTRAAEAAAAAARRARRPDVEVFADLVNERLGLAHGGSSATAGARVRWAAFDGTRAARCDEAEATRRQAAAAEAATRAAVRSEVIAAYRRAAAARERFVAAQGGAEDAAEALRVLRARRAAGVATLSDELAAENEALSAALEERRALTELALADAALRRAVGASPPPAPAAGDTTP